MSDISVVRAAHVEQEFEAANAVAALSDSGINAYYKACASDNILGLPGAIGCPESFDIFVNDNELQSACDILTAIGCIDPDDAIESTAPEAELPDEAAQKESVSEPQTLADLFPDNPILAAVYKVLIAVLALAFLGGFVWLCDTVIAWVMGLFS